ncbi:aspartate/glutamate racemase family protein [Desulfogranum japonicum]|uniref:aspartate/glutamate racemase family protein n=1 Tax=Desulfogranum japonicum TaxID=231447 RepID=UPI000427D385|nr:aspartate/glutamate racemase family protein [Desulfogranum japonicum]
MSSIHLCLINPNSTASMTEKCGLAANRVVGPGTQVKAVNPTDSPASIQGYYDVAMATGPMLEIIQHDQVSDAFIIACFDDTGLDAARCLTSKPVIGIGEAAFHMASLISCRFSVVTTLRRSVPGIEGNLQKYGLAERCAGVRASDIPVLDLENQDASTVARLDEMIATAINEDHAEAIVLGCAGMVDMVHDLEHKHGLPFVDGVTSAVTLAEAMVRCGLYTSKIGGYAPVSAHT